MTLPEEVREHCAAVAARATSVRIDPERLEALSWPGDVPEPGLDPLTHYLEGPEPDVATYLLTLDAINFGSGWFPTLVKRRRPDGSSCSGYFTVAWGLADRFRAHGPWTAHQLRALTTTEVAETLGQHADHELMALHAEGLRALGRFLGDRTALDLVSEARGSASALARSLAGGCAQWADRGFYKRAQILPSDLQAASITQFADLDDLTIFADNLVPHVLRCEGVLAYSEPLAQHVDAGLSLPMGPWEREIRACAVHACVQVAARLGIPERHLDHVLWDHGQRPEIKARPRHRCRTVYY